MDLLWNSSRDQLKGIGYRPAKKGFRGRKEAEAHDHQTVLVVLHLH